MGTISTTEADRAMPMLDGVLDFVSIELLGCAMPRQKRQPSVIQQPRRLPATEIPPFEVDRTIDRSATTWSNGYQEQQNLELRANW